ncbi:MAG: HAMP domain-containing histidine kinase [Helicobacteraceae bacterium]|nr:HAMP domain-containing histidine kinase [Helicobacteraceae bacterium]
MFSNYKKIIIKILILYLGTSIAFLSILFYSLERKESRNIFLTQIEGIRDTTFAIIDIIRKNNHNIPASIEEIKANIDTNFAIYDNRNLLFSNLARNPTSDEMKKGIYHINDKVVINHYNFLKPMHSKMKIRKEVYQIFIEDSSIENEIWLNRIKLGIYFILICIAMGMVAYSLVRLFLKPLNEHLEMLDAFIKDSTHEINTPLSVILMSVETLKLQKQDNIKKLQRIKLASLQLSQIYKDLLAYNFPSTLENEIENFNLEIILKERLEFFAPFFAQKQLKVESNIKSSHLNASKEKIIRLFDNLINNAIKYNKKGGFIKLTLKPNYFSIKDSGCGIKDRDKERIFERYTRCNVNAGGFGIGLSMVKRICEEYTITIELNSNKDGSEFILRW